MKTIPLQYLQSPKTLSKKYRNYSTTRRNKHANQNKQNKENQKLHFYHKSITNSELSNNQKLSNSQMLTQETLSISNQWNWLLIVQQLHYFISKMKYRIDFFLQCIKVMKKYTSMEMEEEVDINLMCITIFWLCSKVFENRQINIINLLSLRSNQLKVQQIIESEQKMIHKLNFDIIIEANEDKQMQNIEMEFKKQLQILGIQVFIDSGQIIQFF